MKLKPYLTYLDYSATGEGHLIQIALTWAESKEQAKQNHFKRFQYSDWGEENYFGPGIEVYSLCSKKSKEILKFWFVNPEKLMRVWKEAGCSFKFEFSYNYS